MATIEAMLCGTPVVISNNVGISSDVSLNEAGVVVDLNTNSDNLFEAIRDLLNDDERKIFLSNRGIQFVKNNYAPSVVIERFKRLCLSNKKILYVSPAHEKAIAIGGPVKTDVTLAQMLVELGHQVDVVSSDMGLSGEDRKVVKFGKWCVDNEFLRRKHFRFYGYSNFTFTPFLVFFLLFNLRKYDYVILSGVWNYPPLITSFVARLYKIRYAFIPHGTLYPQTIEMKSKVIKRIFLQCGVLKLLKSSDKILFTTQDEKDKVSKYLSFDEQIGVVIPNAIDPSEYSKLPPQGSFRNKYPFLLNKRYLLHFGRISKKKGLDILIPVFAKLSARFPELYLVVAGGDLEGYSVVIEELIAKHNIQEKVIFTGLLNAEQSLEVLVDSELFVLPSYSENFGMAVIEAMLCGIPVVISDNVGISTEILLNEAGVVVELNKDNDNLLNAISKLLNDKEKRGFLAQRGIQFVKDTYATDVILEKLRQLIK